MLSTAITPMTARWSRPILPQHVGREVTFLELALAFGSLAVAAGPRLGIRTRLAAGHEILPGGEPPRLELLQEVPQGRPGHVVGEGRIPGDGNAQGEVLLGAEIAGQLALHERQRAGDRR